MNSFLYFWKYIDKKILFIISSLFNSFNGLLYSFIFAQTTHMLLLFISKSNTGKYYILFVIMIPIIAVLFGYYTTYTSKTIKVIMENNLKKELTKKVLYSTKKEYDSYGKDKIINHYLYDIQTVSNTLTTKISAGMINPVITVLGSMIFLILINYKLCLFSTFFACIIYCLNKISIKSLSKIEKKIYAYNTYELQYLNDIYYGKKKIQIYNLYAAFLAQLNKLLQFYVNLNTKKIKIANLKDLSKDVVKGIVDVLFILFYLYLVQHDGIELLTIFGAKKYATNIIDLLTSFSDVIADLKVNKVVFNRTKQLFDSFENKDIELKHSTLNNIVVSNLSLCLENKQIFSNLNFCITEKQRRILIKGRNGCGKSTLALCLCGIENRYSGDIKTHNANIVYIPSNPMIFNTTLYNNITLWNSDIRQSEIRKSLTSMHLDERFNTKISLFSKLKNEISTGELQRIGIIRALFAPFNIIIFDEPTANIDQKNKKASMNFIFNALGDKCLIIISHEAEESDFDQIINLERNLKNE